MTKKRFIKLVLSYHIQRNEAFALTLEVSKAGSYKRLFLWFLIRRFPVMLQNSYNPNNSAMSAIKSEAAAQRYNPAYDAFAEELYTSYIQQNNQTDKITCKLNCIAEAVRRAMKVMQTAFRGIANYMIQTAEAAHAAQAITNSVYGTDPVTETQKTDITITPPTFRAAAITRNISDHIKRVSRYRRETMQYGS